MTSTGLQLAISELLRAAQVCVGSGDPAVRAMSVLLVNRAYGLASGEIAPAALTEQDMRYILDLIPDTIEANRALGTRQLRAPIR